MDEQTSTPGAGRVLADLATAISGHDWGGLRALLTDDCEVELLHTGERFGPDAFVGFNRDYPGEWDYVADEVVDGGARAVLRAHTEVAGETFHVASFASVRDGRVAHLLEIWTEAVAAHPERHPGGAA